MYDILFDPLINGSESRGCFVLAKWLPDKLTGLYNQFDIFIV